MSDPFKPNGGSKSSDEVDRSFVGRSFITKACPPTTEAIKSKDPAVLEAITHQ